MALGSYDPAKVAARFRYYADVCRAHAQSSPEYAADLLKQAAQCEADARMVELDARLIERSMELLARVSRLVPDEE